MKHLILSLLLIVTSSSFAGSIAKSASATSPIEVGKTIKNSQSSDAKGKMIKAHDLVKKENAVFVFFRGQWCPFCMKHIKTLSSLEAKLKETKSKLYLVSAENTKKAKKLQKQFPNFTVIADVNGKLMSDFGIAFNSGRGILPVPAVYLVSAKDKKVVFAHADKNYRKRLPVADIETALDNFVEE